VLNLTYIVSGSVERNHYPSGTVLWIQVEIVDCFFD
jgi:hypothetical protein